MNAIRMRLGTRRSTLATTQSGWVAQCLRDLGHEVEIVEITTFGDTSTAPLSSIGGTGVFVTAIRKALLDGEIDVAVHSLKDLPVAPEPGLRIAAIPVREDPRDALVARDGLTLGKLPAGSVVGTGSPRRAAQLTALGLDVSVMDIRGNVDTRISMVHNGSCDAVLLARAGLARLGRLDEVSESLDPEQMLPAPGQGALAVECREDRPDVIEALSALDDPDTRAAVSAERALLAALEAGCTAPVGALATVAQGENGAELHLLAFAGSEDASIALRRSAIGPLEEPERLGRELAAVLLTNGADKIVGLRAAQPSGGGSPNDQPDARGPDVSPGAPAFRPDSSRPDQTATERAL